MLLRTIYLSLDPYMRGRMNAEKSYAEPVPVGGVMEGGTVSVVEQSNNGKFQEGDILVGRCGWQDYVVSDGTSLGKVDPGAAPISTALGVLGMPGLTAYSGLLRLGKPKEAETLVVAAASGAVGANVGQIAKIKGCRAVGVAGGPDKCEFVVNELGFDACVDHRADNFEAQLAAACPDGIDIYFENVAGRVLEAVIPLFNFWARMPVCGLIAQYNMQDLPQGTNMLPALMRAVLTLSPPYRRFHRSRLRRYARRLPARHGPMGARRQGEIQGAPCRRARERPRDLDGSPQGRKFRKGRD